MEQDLVELVSEGYANSADERFFRALGSNHPCQQPLRMAAPEPPLPATDTTANNAPVPDHITIYPTIGNGHVIIKGDPESLLDAFIIVNDQLGREVYKRRNSNRQTTVECDLHTLSKGLYFIRVQKANRVITKKIIIN
jgi:hypothetical protein